METNKTNINWFPGHMAKAIREIKEKLNIVDMVIEVCDSRAYKASINPVVQELSKNKFYLKVFTKIDLADENVLKGISLLGNLANTSNYEYTEADTAKIIKTLKAAVADLERTYNSSQKNTKFKL
jgi:ribosome biogenesis GTPase A